MSELKEANVGINEEPRLAVTSESEDSTTEGVDVPPPLTEVQDAGPPNGGLVAWLQVTASCM